MENSSAWIEKLDVTDVENLEGEDAESLIYEAKFPNGTEARMRLDRQGSVVARISDPFHEYKGETLNFRSNIDSIDYELDTSNLARYTSSEEREEIDELMNRIWQQTVSYR